MLPDATIDSAAKTLAEFRTNDALNDILDQYAVLIEDYKRLKSDYQEEREGRERYKQLVRGQERNPFALVVVDGDGYIFDERFVKDGEEGGSRAAKQLIDTIKDSLRHKGLESCEVMVRVYANLKGLSKTLCKNGLAGAEKRSFSTFTAGFNRSYGLADFVDAGELKENADFKVKAVLRLYADNTQCKHIYFAACHDVGYVSDLIPFRGNRERFTLIRTPGVSFHKEFDRLGMNVEELPGVFRHVPLTWAYSAAQTRRALASSSNMSKVVSAPYTNSKIQRNTNDDNSNSTPSPSPIGTTTKGLIGDWRHSSSTTKSNIESLPRKDDIPDGYVAINAIMHNCIIHARATTVDMNMDQLTTTCSQRLNIFHVLYLVRVGEVAEEQTVFMAMYVNGQIAAIDLVGKAIVVSAREFAQQIIFLPSTLRQSISLRYPCL
ncbi:uncharacterized protein FFNC_15604 [Fusarium fujikuroi]|nr:uncharacterized protein FFNC_15604 [Fusarium fujikuroi]